MGAALMVGGLTLFALEHTQPGLVQAKSREAAQTLRTAVSTCRSAAQDLASEGQVLASEACTELTAELTARATIIIGKVREAGAAATVAIQR